MRQSKATRWLWAAEWPDGAREIIVTDRWTALERRGMALGMGGPSRILCGPVPAKMTDAAALEAAARQLNS